ncbi:MAG TPA: NAD(P)-dependent oxidoreductase [Pseudonocardiaceae bacterium]|jgi:3-hydroxyisobutyrate dehydrogenase|nr:NAD(P)-dependent oxidoreductase [Pseudonocardiaceae bacterium]
MTTAAKDEGTSVAVLGTGLMGAGMARSLARAGLAVRAWNRSADKARPLATDGVSVHEDVTEAVSGADVVLTMLFDADSVAGVMKQVIPALGKETVWAQTSTVGLDGTEELAALADKHSVSFVDSPVLGTRQPAEDGKLIVLAGGPSALRDKVSPVFDAIGARTVWVGERPGDGHRLKLVANSWVLSLTTSVAQAVAFARDLGVQPQQFLDVIAGGPLDSAYAQLKAKSMIDGEFPPAFGLSGAVKDSGLILDAMREAGTDSRVIAAVLAEFQDAERAGHGAEDMAAVLFAFGDN